MTSAIAPYDVVFFDLDGVIYLGPNAVPGAPEGVAALRAAGVRPIFVTNNAARSAETVAAHLTELGFHATVDDLITSAQASAALLKRELPAGASVLVAGTQNLVNLVEEAGFTTVTQASDEPDAVIQGYDPEMTWPRLDQAALAVQRGARWFASNTDSTRPTEHGLVPGAGMAVAAVAATTTQKPTIIGKPFPPLLEEAMRRTQPRRALFVGDRTDTDIEGASAVGMDSYLVFTGVHGKRDLLIAPEAGRPTAIGADIPSLLKPLRVASVEGATARCNQAVVTACEGKAVITGPLDTYDEQLDALWALAQLVWSGAASEYEDALALLNAVQ